MKLLDTTFLIHYWAGREGVRDYLERIEEFELTTTTLNIKEIAVGRALQGKLDRHEILETFNWVNIIPFQTEHAFSEPGEYGVIAQVSLDDGRTVELTYTVEVRDEPSQGTVDLSLQPGEADVPPGATRAYDLVAEGTTNGVGSYDTEITIEDTDVAEIVDARAFQKSAGLFEIEIAEDGSSVSLSGLVQFDAASEITLAEIAVESADTEGETSLDLAVTEINDGDGNPYTVGGATGATLTVSEEAGPPALPGQDDPPQDIDGDSLYEDIDGNDEFTIGDVQIFFQNRDSDVVQNNPEAFNFDERKPPGISVGDVQALFQLFGSLTVSSTR